jgi:hypothetical protein
MNNWANAAAVVYGCSDVYVEIGYLRDSRGKRIVAFRSFRSGLIERALENG